MKLISSYSLPVTIFREGDAYVAYSPALDLSSAGKTEKAARHMFGVAVDLFFEELEAMGTLEVALTDLGWTKKRNGFQPPRVVDHSIISFQIPALA